jgi:GT2 family glycosyltransferase
VNNIIAVVVTYNRLELLKKVLESLRSQTLKPFKIIVVNNGSTDGTLEWLGNQDDLEIITQDNIGSSGGQFTGIKAAFESGEDWIWVMDDDVIPAGNCLENLVKEIGKNRIHAPLRYDKKNKPFHNDVKKFNISNPFRSIWDGVIDKDDIKKEFIKAEGITFEGPLFHRTLVEKIGLPEKEFFIYGDDTEFFIRAVKAGYKIYVIRDACSQRQLEYADPSEEFSWKHYYVIRNIIAIDVLHGNLGVRTLRPFAYLLKWIFTSKSFNDIKTTFKAFKDGYFYKSGNQDISKI